MNSSLLVALLSVLGPTAVGPVSAPDTHPVTAPPVHLRLSEAIGLALEADHELQASTVHVEEAEHLRKSVRGRFGPTVSVTGAYTRWNSAADIEVVDASQIDLSALPTSLQGVLAGLAQPITVLEKDTSVVALSVTQPLTPLYKVYQGHEIAKEGVEIARLQASAAHRKVSHGVVEAYFRLARVLRLQEVAVAAVDTISAHVELARKFEAQGMLQRSDILAAEVELARAAQQKMQVDRGVLLARADLARRIGLPPHTAITIDALPQGDAPKVSLSLAEACAHAVQHRPEIGILKHAVGVAKRRHKIAQWDHFVPDAALVGQYQRVDGVPVAPENSWFVGATAHWTLWEWGRGHYEAAAAADRVEQAAFVGQDVAGKIELEVQARYSALETARGRLTLSHKAVEQATEGLRLAHLLFAQASATSTDVLDAQTRLTQAQGEESAARAEMWTSLSGLRLAMGEGAEPDVSADFEQGR